MCHHFHPSTDVKSCDEKAPYHGSSMDTLTHIHLFCNIDMIIPDPFLLLIYTHTCIVFITHDLVQKRCYKKEALESIHTGVIFLFP